MKHPANDVCIVTGDSKYLDVCWNYKGRWSVYIDGNFIGYRRTRRLAKKAAKLESNKELI